MKILIPVTLLFIFLHGSMSFAIGEERNGPCDGNLQVGGSFQQRQASAVDTLLRYVRSGMESGIYTPQQIERWLESRTPSLPPRVPYTPQSSGLLDAIAFTQSSVTPETWPIIQTQLRQTLRALKDRQLQTTRARWDTEAVFRWKKTEIKTVPDSTVSAQFLSSKGEFYYADRMDQDLNIYQRGNLVPLKTFPHPDQHGPVVFFETSKGEVLLAAASYVSLIVFDVRSPEVPIRTYDQRKNPRVRKNDYITKQLMIFEQTGEVKLAVVPNKPINDTGERLVFVLDVKSGVMATQELDVETDAYVQLSPERVVAMGTAWEGDRVRHTIHDVGLNKNIHRATIPFSEAPTAAHNFQPFAFLDRQDQPQMGVVAGEPGTVYSIDWQNKKPRSFADIVKTNSWNVVTYRGKDGRSWFATVELSELDKPTIVYGELGAEEKPVRIPLTRATAGSGFGTVKFVESPIGLHIYFVEFSHGTPGSLIVVDVLAQYAMPMRLPHGFTFDLKLAPIYNPADQSTSVFLKNDKKEWLLFEIFGRQAL